MNMTNHAETLFRNAGIIDQQTDFDAMEINLEENPDTEEAETEYDNE